MRRKCQEDVSHQLSLVRHPMAAYAICKGLFGEAGYLQPLPWMSLPARASDLAIWRQLGSGVQILACICQSDARPAWRSKHTLSVDCKPAPCLA